MAKLMSKAWTELESRNNRRPGLIRDLIYDLNITLSDNNGNDFESGGGGIHAALLVSSGVLGFNGTSEVIDIGDEFVININGQNYRLY